MYLYYTLLNYQEVIVINRVFIPLSFFVFILYIIFLADSAEYNFAFEIVGHISYGDKIAHALLYGVMALALNYGLGFKSYAVMIKCHYTRGSMMVQLQLGSVAVFIFAFLEELSQYYIPSRTFDMGDLLADLIGIVIFSFYTRSKACNITT